MNFLNNLPIIQPINADNAFSTIIPCQKYDFLGELKNYTNNEDLIDFMMKCLKMNPKERMTPEEGLNHPLITQNYF